MSAENSLTKIIQEVVRDFYGTTGVIVQVGVSTAGGDGELCDIRPFFRGAKYITCDTQAGPGVDRLENPHNLSFPDNYADMVICLDILGRVFDPILALKELKRILKPGGILILSSTMKFPLHHHHEDYWRFTPAIFWRFLCGFENRWVLTHGDPRRPRFLFGIGTGDTVPKPLFPKTIGGEALSEIEGLPVSGPGAAMSFRRVSCVVDLSNENSSHTRILKRVKPGSRVLELGSGPGHMTAFLTERLRCSVSCVEINEEDARLAGRFAERVIVEDLDVICLREKFRTGTFDIIICADVLEHLKNPGRLMESLPELLSERGRILISIPNAVHASIALDVLDGKFNYRSSGLLDRGHLRMFSLVNFIDMLEASGLSAVSVERITVEPWESEFHTLWHQYPREITSYIEKVNPEYRTYQFVLEAVPMKNVKGALRISRSLAAASQAGVGAAGNTADDESIALRQRLASMENSLSWRLTRPLRRIKHGLLKRKGVVS